MSKQNSQPAILGRDETHLIEPPALSAQDLKVGRVYRAKKPKFYGLLPRLRGDRQIIYLGGDQVQYNEPELKVGRHYTRTTVEKFLQWAAEDVTDQLPKGEWAEV